MLRLTADQMKSLSSLWEQLQDVDPAGRPAWLDSLGLADEPLRQALADMLARDECRQPNAFLRKGIDFTLSGLNASAEELCAGSVVGPYRLVRELGRGGMGIVWLGERADGLMERTVAIKLPHAWLAGSRFVLRFAQERQILATLCHPNIARLYEAGLTQDGHPYLALEYVDGESLTAYCENKALDVAAQVELFLQVLDAVQFAHERRVVHRDLKPSNVLVSADGRAHLLDFGTAKLLEEAGTDSRQTQFGDAALTPTYASPEQVAGGAVGPQSDVFALGVLLYELLTGRLPYRPDRPTRAAMEEAVLSAPVPAPSEVVSRHSARHLADRAAARRRARELRGDLDAIVLTALQRDPERRFVSARAFADDLRRYLAGEPVRSRRDSLRRRSARFILRYRRGVAATALVVAGLGAAVVVSVREAQEAWRQERVALQQREIAQRQEAIASQNARTASEVVEFLKGLFVANQPEIGATRKPGEITARELLDVGAAHIDASLKDAPESKERLLGVITEMYSQIDAAGQAQQAARKRLALARTLHDPGRRRLVDALMDSASTDMSADGPGAARANLEEATALLAQAGPAQPDDDLLRGRLALRWSYLLSQSDVAGAIVHIERADRLLKAYPASPDYASALVGMAHFRMRQRRFDDAQRALSEALRVLPPNDAGVLDVQTLLCDLQLATGQRASAEGVCRAAFETAVKVYGDADGTVATASRMQASALIRFGRVEEARALLQGRLAMQARLPGEAARQALGASYVTLASIENMAGRPAQAGRWLHALAALHLGQGKSDGMQVRAMPALAEAEQALAQGRFNAALAAADAAMAAGKAYGMDLSGYGDGVRALAVRARIGRGDLAGAAAALAEFDHAPPTPAGESEHPVTEQRLDGRLLHGELALAQGHAQDAAARAVALRQLVESQPAPALFQPVALSAELLAGRAEAAQGNAAQAVRHFAQAAALAAPFGQDSLFLAEALAGEAKAREAAGDTAPAGPLAARAEAIARAQGARWPLPGF